MERVRQKYTQSYRDDWRYNRQVDGTGIKPADDNGYRYDPELTQVFTQPVTPLVIAEDAVNLWSVEVELIVPIRAYAAMWAEHARDANFTERRKTTHKTKREKEPEPRKPATNHKELVHQFTDGTVRRRCPLSSPAGLSLCDWGKETPSGYRKRHSNHLTFVIPEIDVETTEDGEGLVEVSPDDPQTLDLSPRSPIAGAETLDDFEPEQENEEQVEVGSDDTD